LNLILYTPSIHTGGGTERVLVNLSNQLIKKGHDITIISQKIGDNYVYDLNESVVLKQVWYDRIREKYGKKLIFKLLNKFCGGVILQLSLKKHIGKDITLIITFSNSIIIECYRTKYKEKLVAFEHWPYWKVEQNKKLQIKINNIYPKLKRVIVLTEYDKKVYESLGCKVSLIPNSYSHYPKRSAKLNQKIVLSIGHFNDQKRRDLLIKSWKIVNNNFPEWTLIIVGDGNLKTECIQLINRLDLQDAVKIIAPTNDIYSYYLEASIFVLSSEYEALPLVLIEAKTFGLPCVSFDIKTGPNEIIRNDVDGFLAPFADCEMLAEKINVLISDEDLRKKFGEAARKNALFRFDPVAISNKWDDFLDAI